MSSDPHLDASGIVQRQFTTARRGYDVDEVRAYLHELATLVGNARRSEAELRERAEKAESRAHKAEQLDEHRLVEILGEETARVLDAARAASTDIRGKAEESASRLISEANHEAHRVRAEAEAALAAQRNELLAEVEKLRADAATELDRRRAEGNELVAQMRREAQAECDTLRQQGEQKRLEAEMQAEAIRAKAREEGRALIAEAQVVRERVLGDLARRRRSAREQLERLNAGRERLLAAYEVVRRTVDEATGELTVVLPEAKVAGDSAVRRVKGEPEPSVEQLEDMVAMARITGLLEDATSQGFDEEDYLADDAPPPEVVVEGAPAPESVSEPAELYDRETESELFDELPSDASGVEAEVATVAADVPEPVVAASVVEAVEDEIEAAARTAAAEAAPANGRSTPAAVTVEVAPEPEPAVAAVVVVPDAPRPAGGGGPGEPVDLDWIEAEVEAAVSDVDEPDADPSDGGEPDDDGEPEPDDEPRRVNGHAHIAIDVDEDGHDLDDLADLGDDDAYVEDLGEDDWPDEDEDDEDVHDGAPSSVDALFARLRADRDEPEPEQERALEHETSALDEAEAGPDAGEAEPDDGEPARRRVSSLMAMSDEDILASAGYGDAYGDSAGDDTDGTDDAAEYDVYGLPITQPEPQALVDALGGDEDEAGDDEDDGADFAEMDPDEAMLRLRDDSLETVEHDLSRRLKRVLADEQNEVLDTLRRHKPSSLDDLLPGGSDAHVARYADAAVEGLSTAAAWGAASVDGEPDGSYAALAAELGRAVVVPLRERIDRSFTAAAGDVDDVTGRLRALYREWKGHHIGAAAQHYAVAAYARGAYEGVPDGTPVRWLVDRSGDACPDADDNALADSVCKGDVFPTGDRCPPAHPGCRCMVVPLDWPKLG